MSDDNKPTPMSRRKLLFGALDGIKQRQQELRKELDEVEHEKKKDTRKDEPSPAQIAFTKAEEARECGDCDTAVDMYRRCIYDDLNHDTARMHLGKLLYDKEQYIQARVEFERVIRIRSGDPEASLFLGLCLCKTGKHDRALRAWKECTLEESDPRREVLQRQIEALESVEQAEEEVLLQAAEAVEKAMRSAGA